MKRGFFNVLLPRKDEDAVAILLYGQIGSGEKMVDSAAVVAELMGLADKYKNIDVRINSMGGEVYAGMAIFNALRSDVGWQKGEISAVARKIRQKGGASSPEGWIFSVSHEAPPVFRP